MYDVQEYIDFVKDLKADPSQIIVAGIMGPPQQVVVGRDDDDNPALEPSCANPATGEAAPAVRLKTFIDAFPTRNSVTTICNEDLSDALVVIAELLKQVIGSPCLDGKIKDVDPGTDGVQPECQVSDVVNPGQDSQEETVLPACDNTGDPAASGNLPCFHIFSDPDNCGDTPSGLSILTYPENRPLEPGTHTIVRCVAE
jgi:hypothetical protein